MHDEALLRKTTAKVINGGHRLKYVVLFGILCPRGIFKDGGYQFSAHTADGDILRLIGCYTAEPVAKAQFYPIAKAKLGDVSARVFEGADTDIAGDGRGAFAASDQLDGQICVVGADVDNTNAVTHKRGGGRKT